MLNNGNKKECGFSDEIVAYIYDEIGQVERRKFESHLAGCTSCTDEFAGISNARFSVFEWRREEFAHLLTPETVIPYAAKKREIETVGFFGGLRDLLTLSGWPSAVMVAGAVVICIGLGFVVMNYVGSGPQVAENKKPVVNEKAVPPAQSFDEQKDVAASPTTPLEKDLNPNGTTITATSKPTPDREIRPVRASAEPRKVREKNLTASRLSEQASIQQKRKVPALTAYDDDDDKSLRLADLFGEGGIDS